MGDAKPPVTLADGLRDHAHWLESRSFANLSGEMERKGADEIERLQLVCSELETEVERLKIKEEK